MKSAKDIKLEARNLLQKGKWTLGIATFSLMFSVYVFYVNAINICVAIISGNALNEINIFNLDVLTIVLIVVFSLIVIVVLFLLMPVFTGAIRMFLDVAYDKNLSFRNIFYCYIQGKTRNAINFWVTLVVKYFISLTLTFLPLISILVVHFLDIFKFDDFVATLVLLIVGIFIAFVYILVVASRYFLAPYLFVIYGELSANDSIKLSVKIMEKKQIQYEKLIVSFIPWFLLCFLVFPAFYVVPYFLTSCAVNAKYMIEDCLEETKI